MAWLKGQTVDGFVEIDKKVRFKEEIQDLQSNLVGDTWYVRNNGSDSANGKSIGKAFKTLSYAVHHAAGAYDKIIIMQPTDAANYLVEAVQGTDDANLPITINQVGLKIFGDQDNWRNIGMPTVHTHVNNGVIFAVGANNVEIAGLTILTQCSGGMGIRIGDGAISNRVSVHHSMFLGIGTTCYGIATGAAAGGGYGAPWPQIDRCRFTGFTSAGVFWSGQDGATITDCLFDWIPAAGAGIECSNTTTFGFPCAILNNRFQGESNTDSASGSTGINNPASMEGKMYIDGNSFMYLGASRAIVNKTSGVCGVNYLNGALITY